MWRLRQPLADTGVPPAEADEAEPARREGSLRSDKRARRVSPRQRRALVRSLRQAAERPRRRDGARRRFEVLLVDRAASVRPELLELANALEECADPDPASLADLRRLLTDGCQSPLYNPDVHISELRATLYYLRAGLTA